MLRNFLRLIRLGQWYKNLLIFLPLAFAPQIAHSWPLLIWGFFGFSCVSSITYIVNDWIDRDEDQKHPLKRHRPLASGAINGKTALFISLLLLIVVGLAVFNLGLFYSLIVGTYFILTNAYSFKLKHIPILDILLITFNFILRTLAGLTQLPDAKAMPYFMAVFALIIMMITYKRRGDIKVMKSKAVAHKPVLKYYTPTRIIILISGAWIVLFGAGYLIGEVKNLPPILAVLISTNLLFYKKPALAVRPKLLLKEWAWDLTLILSIVYLMIS